MNRENSVKRMDFVSNLKKLFSPDTVAVIGASENPGKLGFHVMKSLKMGGFKGKIVPVNPGTKKILGIPALSSITQFQGPIDLAVVVIPAKFVPQIFEECLQRGVKGMVLITAGFKEIDDPAGGESQDLLADMASSAAIPVVGPNTFGIVNLHRRLNASFTPEFSAAKKGGVTLVCQSGGISHLLAFMAMRQNLGISKIIGLGNRLNVDFAEMITFLMDDPHTEVILLYMEGMDDPRRLTEAAAALRGKKPILALKAGSARKGDLASISHTGSMAGNSEIYEGALRQAGILCVKGTEELLDMGRVLSVCPVLEGPRVAILSAQAGPGMVACDVCEMEGLETAEFEASTQAAINQLLPPLALRTNPVDMGPAWYSSSAINGIVRAVMEDTQVDGILLLMMFASANREALSDLSQLLCEWNQKKPAITCLASPPGIWDETVDRLEERGGIINLPTPERAARAMGYLWRCTQILNGRRGTVA
jgi:acetyl-CoA synthetase (ADP-forming)